MKKQLHILIIGILFPFLIFAQINVLPPGNTGTQKQLQHTLLRNSSPVLFPFVLSGFYREDFEGGTFPPLGWQVIDVLNPTYNWELAGSPHAGLFNARIAYDLSNHAGEDWLILPQFSVTATDSITFWLSLEYAGYPPDSTFILVSTTDSAIASFTSVLATLIEGVNYPLAAGVYQYYSFPLDAFTGSDVYIAIKNKNTNGDGVNIDMVSLGTKPVINATALSIVNLKAIQTSDTVSPTATVMNDGVTTQSFPVTMTITGGYTSTKNVISLAPGGTQQITFDPWVAPGTAGSETVSVITQLTGDGYANDDTIAVTINVLEPFTNFGWSSHAPLPGALWGIASTAMNTIDSSYFFALGGVNETSFPTTARKYSPYSNSWSTINPMLSSAFRAHAFHYKNKIYVIGGQPNNTTVTAANRVYNVGTNTWSLAAPAPFPTAGYAAGVYHDSLFYLIGGYETVINLDLVQIYNAASDTWLTGTSIPYASAWCGGISGNKIVISAGFNGVPLSTTFLGVIDASDPTIITWTVGPDYPIGRSAGTAGGASLDESSGLILFTGGVSNNQLPFNSLDATFAYDVNANQWKMGPPKITPAHNLMNFTPVVYNDSLYMVSIGGYGPSAALNVNEWLNMGPYLLTTHVSESTGLNIHLSSFPNPFGNLSELKFSLPQTSMVKASIVNVTGQEIEVICNHNLPPGSHQLKWNAKNYSNGVYFWELIVDGRRFIEKLLKY